MRITTCWMACEDSRLNKIICRWRQRQIEMYWGKTKWDMQENRCAMSEIFPYQAVLDSGMT